MPRLLAFAAVALFVACASATAEDWPHWAGPNSNCTSDETGSLKEWPAGGPKILWRAPIQKGWNHPAVAGDDLVFAETKRDTPYGADQVESIVCLSAATGKLKWKHSHTCPFYMGFQGGGAGWQDGGVYTTPAITEKYVVSIGLVGETFCLDRKTGKEVWKINLRDFNPRFAAKKYVEWKGNDVSPVVVGGVIPYYIRHFHEDRPADEQKPTTLFIGISVDTGKVAWKFETPWATGGAGSQGTSYPIPMQYGKDECFLLSINGGWRIFRASDGKELFCWKNVGEKVGTVKAPLPLGKNLYYDAPGPLYPSRLVECDFSRGAPEPKVLWEKYEMPGFMYTPETVQNGCLFGFIYDKREDSWQIADNTEKQTLCLGCYDIKTGKLLWKQPGFRHGVSLTAADGMLYARDFQTLRLIEANPERYVEKGRIEKLHDLNNKRFSPGLGDWVMPVISDGRLFIRTPVEIICYDIKDPNAAKETAK